MLTDLEKLTIRKRLREINPTPEQVRRFLETQAKQGDQRAISLLEKLNKKNPPTEDQSDLSDR